MFKTAAEAATTYREALRESFKAIRANPGDLNTQAGCDAAERVIKSGKELEHAERAYVRAYANEHPGDNYAFSDALDNVQKLYAAERAAYIRKHGQPGRPRPTNPRTVAAHERRNR